MVGVFLLPKYLKPREMNMKIKELWPPSFLEGQSLYLFNPYGLIIT